MLPLSTFYRIQNAVNPGNPVFALVLLHALSSPLVGAVNAVVYGLDAETRSRLSWTQIKVSSGPGVNFEPLPMFIRVILTEKGTLI